MKGLGLFVLGVILFMSISLYNMVHVNQRLVVLEAQVNDISPAMCYQAFDNGIVYSWPCDKECAAPIDGWKDTSHMIQNTGEETVDVEWKSQ